jgi:hypothetical protein
MPHWGFTARRNNVKCIVCGKELTEGWQVHGLRGYETCLDCHWTYGTAIQHVVETCWWWDIDIKRQFPHPITPIRLKVLRERALNRYHELGGYTGEWTDELENEMEQLNIQIDVYDRLDPPNVDGEEIAF